MQYNLQEPYFHKGGALDMPAVDKWANEWYLKEKFENPIVTIERYDSDKDMEVSKAEKFEVYFDDFLDNLYENEYLADGYLSDMDVSEDVYNDLINPAVGPEDPVEHLMFVGRNTKSGAHIHVEDDFVLHQIVGKKIVYLMDFEDLSIHTMFSQYGNFSKENFFDLPKSYDSKIHRIEMDPGDVLYIPPWVWHATENIGYSVAVTKVFKRDTSYLRTKRFRSLWWRHYSQAVVEAISSFQDLFRRN